MQGTAGTPEYGLIHIEKDDETNADAESTRCPLCDLRTLKSKLYLLPPVDPILQWDSPSLVLVGSSERFQQIVFGGDGTVFV